MHWIHTTVELVHITLYSDFSGLSTGITECSGRFHYQTSASITNGSWTRYSERYVLPWAIPRISSALPSAKCRWFCLRGGHGRNLKGDAVVIGLAYYFMLILQLTYSTMSWTNRNKKNVVTIFIAPSWSRQMWFPELIHLSRWPPFHLPLMVYLLTQELGSITLKLFLHFTSRHS